MLCFNGKPSIKHLQHELRGTIHANLTAMDGTNFLIIRCLPQKQYSKLKSLSLETFAFSFLT